MAVALAEHNHPLSPVLQLIDLCSWGVLMGVFIICLLQRCALWSLQASADPACRSLVKLGQAVCSRSGLHSRWPASLCYG